MKYNIILIAYIISSIHSQMHDRPQKIMSVEEKLSSVKLAYDKETNLYLKTQMKVILDYHKYSIEGDGEVFTKNDLVRASIEILFPIKGLFEEWVVENTIEKVNEIIDSEGYRNKAITREEFLGFCFWINPESIFGKFLWNKVKDLQTDLSTKKKKTDM